MFSCCNKATLQAGALSESSEIKYILILHKGPHFRYFATAAGHIKSLLHPKENIHVGMGWKGTPLPDSPADFSGECIDWGNSMTSSTT